MEIFGPSLDQLIKHGGTAARHMRYSIRLVVLALVSDVNVRVPSADDLVKAQVYWEKQVDKVLQPDVASALLYGGDLVRKALGRDDIPAVTNPYVEWYLLTTRNRLSGVGNIVWETARFQLLDGLAEGEDIDALRTRIRKTTGLAAPRAETIARTEAMGAMNAGSLIQMQSAGVPFTKTWLATGGPRTRPSHAKADGQTVDGKKKFTVGGWPMDRPHDPSAPAEETENCVIGSTEVDAPLIKVAMRRWFSGEIIVIHTAAGKTLSVTPNHPILTDDGWVPAQQLKVGDHVVRGDVRRHITTQHNEQRGPTIVAEIFDTAPEPSIPEYRERRTDFHGERAVCKIHVVAEDRSLGLEVVPALEQEVLEFGFTAANLARLGVGNSQTRELTFGITGRFSKSDGVGIASRGVGGQGLPAAIIDRHGSHAEFVGFSNSTDLDVVCAEDHVNPTTRDVQVLTDASCRFSVAVTLDDLVVVERRAFRGHVYNLSTTGGWYTSNSIITRNCRCTLTFEIKEETEVNREKRDRQLIDTLLDDLGIAAAE